MQLTKSLLHTTDVYIRKLREAGIETTSDFLSLFPREYEDKSDALTQFSLINITEKQAIKCTIELLTHEMTRNKKLLIKAVLTDSDGIHAEAVWFNQRMILSKFASGDTVLIFGKAKYEYGRLSFPSVEIEHYREKRQEIMPVYSDVNYIPGSWIREKMAHLKPYLEEIDDDIPSEIQQKK
jgi:ATP-dependent DNA helicase RecG